ncbi:MAG: exo-alpha-sialidase [Verrucomicrobia bacterium]|nr:exo-alpha-sialidase [Verrucomicrobiota bacterium]
MLRPANLAPLAAFLVTASPALDAQPHLAVAELPAPAAAASAVGSSLARDPDGVVWLTWLETSSESTALRFATRRPADASWSEPSTIASGANWFVNWADFPALTAGGGGRATAVWFVNNPAPPAGPSASHDHHGPGYRAFLSSTIDAGRTWSPPAPLTRESNSVEFVSLANLADGRVLAAWLDGRAKQNGAGAQRLYTRVVGSAGPDTLVDASVCDCCQTALTAFPDGTALLAYRGRTADEVRDIRVTRFRGRAWDEPRPLAADDWRINACPVNGPQLASDGGRVAAAWFTAADHEPRVLASFSPDAGARFLQPLRLSDAKPAGRVATALLRDGAVLVAWVDVAGVLWLRRVTPEFSAAEPLALTVPGTARVKGFPRLALLRDYLGGREPAQLLVTFTADAAPTLRTLLVTIPEAELLEAERNCDCAPTPAQLRGYSFRGQLVGVDLATATLQVKHPEVPGVLPEGMRAFRVAPELAAAAGQPGRQFLARIEQRDTAWWLFDLRFLVNAAR